MGRVRVGPPHGGHSTTLDGPSGADGTHRCIIPRPWRLGPYVIGLPQSLRRQGCWGKVSRCRQSSMVSREIGPLSGFRAQTSGAGVASPTAGKSFEEAQASWVAALVRIRNRQWSPLGRQWPGGRANGSGSDQRDQRQVYLVYEILSSDDDVSRARTTIINNNHSSSPSPPRSSSQTSPSLASHNTTHNYPPPGYTISTIEMQFNVAIATAILAYTATAAPSLAARNTVDSCDTQYDQCVTGADANLSTCVSQHETCDDVCFEQYDSCRGAPDANLSTCVATFSTCAGHLPSEEEKRNVSDSCDTQYDQCRSAPDANLSTCVSNQATCEANCFAADDSCRTADDANLSTCNANLATCVGHVV